MPYHTPQEIVQMLAERRAALGWSLATAAEKADVTRQYWHQVENGEAPPPPATLARMAAAVGIVVEPREVLLVKGRRTPR